MCCSMVFLLSIHFIKLPTYWDDSYVLASSTSLRYSVLSRFALSLMCHWELMCCFIVWFSSVQTLEGQTGGHGNHAFWYRVTSSTLNKPNILIGSQSTIENLPFPPLIPRMNSCTSVLQGKFLCHSSVTKCPCRRLRVNWFCAHFI